MKINDGIKLIIAIIVCHSVGLIGAFATAPSIETWYASLTKPFFNPPSWVFGPVWTVLYFMMAVSVWFIVRIGFSHSAVRKALFLFAAQLILNGIWPFLFFGIRSPLAGLFDIILLWVLLWLTVNSFYRLHKPAGILLIPYGVWVSFALILNFSLWRLNS